MRTLGYAVAGLALACSWGCQPEPSSDAGHDAAAAGDAAREEAGEGDSARDGDVPEAGPADQPVADAALDRGTADRAHDAAGDRGGVDTGGGVDSGGGVDTGGDSDAGELVLPDEPGAADVRFDVHTRQGVHPISRYIYGHNEPEFGARDLGLTLARAGGNRWTAYNWENNASNAGTDWYNQNDGYLGGGDAPGGAIAARVDEARAAGAATLVTVPVVGYVAADKAGDGDVGDTANYLEVRFEVSQPRKGAAFSVPPDLHDGKVFQDELIHWLGQSYPDAWSDPARRIMVSLDNEPDLWAETHPRIHSGRARYQELRDLNVAYAQAIKDVAPEALIFGPVNYGWQGFVDLQAAPDAAGRPFLAWYLDEMAAAERAGGRRLLDVLDLHWYPEARGGGVRVTGDDTGQAVARARMHAPRSLWDPLYLEDSWIVTAGSAGPIRLLPRINEIIAAHYPGTRLAITEYYYGAGAHISGGIAQADVLGVFGREGLFAAALWQLGSGDDRFVNAAFRVYRDFDGAGGRFGDTSVQAACDDNSRASVYASVDASGGARVVLVAINKETYDLRAGVAVTHTALLGHARVFQLTAASAAPVAAADLALEGRNAFVYSMPALSVSVLELVP